MKMIVATAALVVGLASPAFAQERAATDSAAWQADAQSRRDLARHRIDAFAQSIRDLPLYLNEPAWQAYAQYRRDRPQDAYAQADIRDQQPYVGNPARRTYAPARRARAQDAFAQADVRDQRRYVGNTARQASAQARRARAQDAFAQADVRDQRLYVRNPAVLRAYAAQFRRDVAQNPLNAYRSDVRDYRIHLGYAPWHVYDNTGEYVGTDPDPFIRNELARDPPLKNDD